MDFLYPLAFWVFAALIAVSAVAIVVTQNIVRAATWLLFALGGVAGIFFLLGAEFVGATQLLVYVGGTLVLVVFGVMLTAQGPFINLRIGAGEWAIAAAVGIGFFSVLAYALVTNKWTEEPRPLANTTVLGESLLGVKVAEDGSLSGLRDVVAPPPPGAPGAAALDPVSVQPVKRRSAMSYLLPFEIVSVHLLVVLIGAAYLARSKRRRGATS